MANQLNLMTQAVGNSDSTAFDNALSALNTDLTILTPPAWNAIFQSDGMAQFKMAAASNPVERDLRSLDASRPGCGDRRHHECLEPRPEHP